MICFVLFLLVFAPSALADDGPASVAREGECVVCAVRGGAHGVERFAAWREFEGNSFGFCSEACAEAFDQMPAGYAQPALPYSAPAFRWTTLEGGVILPTGQTALLVDFWATWCAPCLETIPAFEALWREYAGAGLRVVGISIDEERKTLNRWIERRPVGYPVVHDGGEDPAWWQFRVPAIPAAFLLNGEGQVVARWSGEIDPTEVRAAVQALIDPD